MAFIYNIPQATDDPSISQGQFLGNFTALGSIAGNGTASSNSLNSSAGFNWVLLAQTVTPNVPANFQSGVIGLYSAPSPVTGVNELYINKTNQATVVQIPSTASILSTNSNPGLNSSGWTYLPSGILMKWGQFTFTGGATNIITFPASASIPAFNTCISVLVQLNSLFVPINAWYVPIVTSTTFTLGSTAPNGTKYSYLAIGY